MNGWLHGSPGFPVSEGIFAKGGRGGVPPCHCAQGPRSLAGGAAPVVLLSPRTCDCETGRAIRLRKEPGFPAELGKAAGQVDPNPSMAPRGRVQMRRIEDRVSRQVRFSKRRTGLFKKAMELNVLCDAEVSLLVFSPAGKVYQYSSTSMEDIYDRYQQFAREGRNVNEADQNRNNNQDDSSLDLQSKLREITTWSLQC